MSRLSIPGGGSAPFYPDAVLALDFVNNAFRVGAGASSRADFANLANLTVTRASTGYAETTSGALVQFASGVARITNKGLLYQPAASTNLFLNSFTPATQDITLSATGNYILTVWGTGSVAVVGKTATITGAGTASAGSPVTINCSASGTITCTVSGSPVAVQVEAGASSTGAIATTGSTATCQPDVISFGSLSIASPYTIVAKIGGVQDSAGATDVVLFNDATNGGGMYVASSVAGRLIVNEAGSLTANVGLGSSAVNTALSMAGRFQSNNSNGAMNGTLGTADTTTSPPTLTAVGVGRSLYSFGGGRPFYLRSLVIYPRAFSDAELQAAAT